MKLSHVEIPKNKNFGFFFSFIFCGIALWFLYHNSHIGFYIFFSVSVALLLITLINAEILLPLNRLWMYFGLLLHSIINPLLLGLLFFGLFTPVAVFHRLRGRDELRLKLKNKNTHWISRDSPDQKSDFNRQF